MVCKEGLVGEGYVFIGTDRDADAMSVRCLRGNAIRHHHHQKEKDCTTFDFFHNGKISELKRLEDGANVHFFLIGGLLCNAFRCFRLSMMVRFAVQDGEGAIELLGEDEPRHDVGKGELREGDLEVLAGIDGLGEAVGATDDEHQRLLPRVGLLLDELREWGGTASPTPSRGAEIGTQDARNLLAAKGRRWKKALLRELLLPALCHHVYKYQKKSAPPFSKRRG